MPADQPFNALEKVDDVVHILQLGILSREVMDESSTSDAMDYGGLCHGRLGKLSGRLLHYV